MHIHYYILYRIYTLYKVYIYIYYYYIIPILYLEHNLETLLYIKNKSRMALSSKMTLLNVV
jgi:hypothetical protein